MEASTQPTTSEVPQSKIPKALRGEIHFNAEARSLEPFGWYARMRASDPVYYDQENELWHVFGYEDVLHVLTNPTIYSSEVFQRGVPEEERPEDAGEPSILNLDPPRHRQMRSLVTQAFTPRTVANLTPRIEQIINEYLDQVAASGRMDMIADLAYPLPVIVIAELLGVPAEDREKFKHWSDAVVSPEQKKAMDAANEMSEYLKEVTDQRRKDPRDDLISALLAAQIDGQHLNEGELLSFYMLLLVAGNETTTNLLGNAFICFDEYPEAIDALRANPELIPGAIEEVLRYRSPVQRLIRIVTQDTILHGRQLREGDLITPWTGSANRDETQFPAPDLFDLRRTPNRHVGFGHGIHFCVGAPLSRLEAKVALGIIFRRFNDIRLDQREPLDRIPASSAFYGVQRLPLTFTPVAR